MIYFKHQNIGNSNRFPIFLFCRNQIMLYIKYIMDLSEWLDFRVEFTQQSRAPLTYWGEKSVMTSELGEDWD